LRLPAEISIEVPLSNPVSGSPLARTPLHAAHVALGARMVDFGGWDMPVQYTGVIEEHRVTRAAAGLFDVSHMGEFNVTGAGTLGFLDHITPNDVARLAPGQAQYSALTTSAGTLVDDVIVYCHGPERYRLVVNAANIAKDFAWVTGHAPPGVSVTDVSDTVGLIALQGPRAADILGRLAPGTRLEGLGYFHHLEADVAGIRGVTVARTGYTGEDGFELFVAAAQTVELWQALLAAGEKDGLKPCGLGARDTLRLEAKLPLYGNDIDETTTALEADLGFIVKLKKGDFLGAAVLARQKQDGVARKLVGFEMVDRGIARHGYPVRVLGKPEGAVTSGSYSPSLDKNIGLAYLPAAHTAPGSELEVDIRGRQARARVVPTPFVPHRTLGAKKRA
jgi:aminomethyltransferase